jgi:ArsR family transcriptional regulator
MTQAPDIAVTREKAEEAIAFLKALANENRLMVLCHLAQGERSVTELENLLGIRQPNLSQQLARLRADGLVATRRDAKSIYYSLASPEAVLMIQRLYRLFCVRDDAATVTLTRSFPTAAE